MKSTNVHNLRASVSNGVWSSTNGANRVLQRAWEDREDDEKIIFIFSITHRCVLRSLEQGQRPLIKRTVTSIAANMLEWQKCQGRSTQARTLRSGLQD